MREHAQPDAALTGEPDAYVHVINASGQGDVIFVCEHASCFIPPEFKALGLEGEALTSHIAWDPGALAVARALSDAFDAPAVAPAVSRLVYDCNRPSDAESAIPEQSEIYDIPGNVGLSDADRQARSERFYQPYRKALVDVIDGALAAGRKPAIVTVHSFTPVFKGETRDLELGVLHDEDARLGDALLAAIEAAGDMSARRNAPYGPENGVTYTLREHAISRGLLNVMIEIRNDLIAEQTTQHDMAGRLAGYLRTALDAVLAGGEGA